MNRDIDVTTLTRILQHNGVNKRQALTRLLVWVTIGMSIAQLLLYIAAYSDQVPWWDEWDISLTIASKTSSGELTLFDLFTQHYAHRIVFTNSLTAINTLLFGWDLRFDILVNVVLAVCSFAVISFRHETG